MSVYLPYPLYPLPHDMDIYSYHEGEELKKRGAVAPLGHSRYGFGEDNNEKREMRGKINEELKHIPRGSFDQNMLREYHNGMRRHDLSLNSALPAKDTLIRAIETIKKDKLHFLPIYDREFFR